MQFNGRIFGQALLLALCVTTGCSLAATDNSVCMAMVDKAVRNIGLNTSSSSYYDAIYSSYCKADHTTNNMSLDAGVTAVIEEIPVAFKGASHDNNEAMTNFCRNYQQTSEATSSQLAFESTVVLHAVDAVNDCLRILSKNVEMSYAIMSPKQLFINVGVPSGQSVTIRGVSHEQQVSCEGADTKHPGTKIVYDTSNGQTLDSNAGSYAITCSRSPYSTSGGNHYGATALIVDSTAGPLNIFWPQDAIYPLTAASQLQDAIKRLTEVPIGAIIDWYSKPGAAIPPGFQLCDGGKILIGPLAGENTPNLIHRFTMGVRATDSSYYQKPGPTSEAFVDGSPVQYQAQTGRATSGVGAFAAPPAGGYGLANDTHVHPVTIGYPPFYGVLKIIRIN